MFSSSVYAAAEFLKGGLTWTDNNVIPSLAPGFSIVKMDETPMWNPSQRFYFITLGCAFVAVVLIPHTSTLPNSRTVGTIMSSTVTN